MNPKPERIQSYLYLLINTVCWGAALIVVKPALSFTTPFRFLFYRYLLASFLSLPILFSFVKQKKFQKKLSAGQLAKIFSLELLGTTLALSLLYLGLARTSAIEASLLATTTPIFITLAGIFLLKERQEKHEWLGLLLSFVGTVVLVFNPILTNSTQFKLTFSLAGNLLILTQNLTIALYYVLAKKAYHQLPKLLVTSLSFWVGLITFFFLSLSQLNFDPPLLWQAVLHDWQQSSVTLASLYMATFGSIIGLTAYIKGQEKIEASEASLFTYLQPLVYLPLGFVLLNEKINPWQITSLLIILLGVVMAEKRISKQTKKRPKK
ncbi:MAG: EamA family transporter [Candidatus Pacebacteria bacterium]|nr:EamA family transporter [Candidatus Paceibacterota bacterium]